MDTLKSKTLRNIEGKMENLDETSLRYHILQSAKDFKTSWIELGRSLYSVWRDKLYKEWGYTTMDAYTTREIGIRKPTAMKLLRSYYFLEKEEPLYLQENYAASANAALVPSYESIDVLRLAKNKKALDSHEYAGLKKEIFEQGKDAGQVKKELTSLIKQKEELDPEEARKKRKVATVKRFLTTLKALKTELEMSKLVSLSVIKETANLINKLEAEIG